MPQLMLIRDLLWRTTRISLFLLFYQQVRAIRDLDSQLTWDRLKKIDFFNRLRDILPRLSHQVKVNRIANSLFNEVLNPEVLPHVLPNILIIAEDSTPSEFKAKIFPHLKTPFRVLEPKTIPLMLLDNLPMLSDRAKLCLPEFQQSAFTLIQYLLRTDQQLQKKSLHVLPRVKKIIDIGTMSSILLPELGRLPYRVEIKQRELLAKKSQAQVLKVGPLVLDNFKGSSHFQLD